MFRIEIDFSLFAVSLWVKLFFSADLSFGQCFSYFIFSFEITAWFLQYSPLWKITHQNSSVLCTPPFEKSPIKSRRFYVLHPLENHPSKLVGFVYSPLWKITHQSPSVLCTPPFEKSPIKTRRFCVLPPLKNDCFWWALISGGRLFRQIR